MRLITGLKLCAFIH